MLTSRSSPKHRHQAIQLGANEYMTKPFNKDELLETILLLLT
jgi:DNA-binding response OmpR family regulator